MKCGAPSRATTTPTARITNISWFDWTLVDKHRDVHRFVKELIRLRLHFDKASLEYDLTLDPIFGPGQN